MDNKYIAGYFDGEGSIGLYRSLGSTDPRYLSGRKSPSWVRTVGISNTYLPTLRELYSEFGGSLRILKETDGHKKRIYSWTIGSKDSIARFLSKIVPHLREKGPQAQLMLSIIAGKVDEFEAAIKLKELKHVLVG